jgi:hypothetical protein
MRYQAKELPFYGFIHTTALIAAGQRNMPAVNIDMVTILTAVDVIMN